jgi:hypothetical protein
MTRLLGATGSLDRKGTPRFMRFVPDDPIVITHLQNRAKERSSGATRAFRDRSDLRAVNFSACQAVEVAYENDGNGDFTRITTALLTDDLSRCTNVELQQRIIDRFGAARRQTPDLDCTAEMGRLRFLAPLAGVDAKAGREVAMLDRRGLAIDRRADPLQRDPYDRRSLLVSGRRKEDPGLEPQDAETLRAIARKIDDLDTGDRR